ncbi:hypothetical protein D9M69_675160 [compost metagenome]
MFVLSIAGAGQAGPDVPALRNSLRDAAGLDVGQGTTLADLLDGDPVLVLRSESAVQLQRLAVGIPVPGQELVPAGRRRFDA